MYYDVKTTHLGQTELFAVYTGKAHLLPCSCAVINYNELPLHHNSTGLFENGDPKLSKCSKTGYTQVKIDLS